MYACVPFSKITSLHTHGYLIYYIHICAYFDKETTIIVYYLYQYKSLSGILYLLFLPSHKFN